MFIYELFFTIIERKTFRRKTYKKKYWKTHEKVFYIPSILVVLLLWCQNKLVSMIIV